MTQDQVQLLSPSVRSHLRSSVAITSFSHAVEELLHNAIDAKASKIYAKIDLQTWGLTVSDNGSGISPSDLGKIGTRYFTSKCHAMKDIELGIKTLGYRGEALASLIQMCWQVRITSKISNGVSYSVSIINGVRTEVSKSIKPLPIIKGTSIMISGFMYNMPVRRRNLSAPLILDEVKHCVTGLCLANHKIGIILYDECNKEELIKSCPKESILDCFRSNFGSSIWSEKNLLAINKSNESLLIKGIVGTEGVANKRQQFIFVNQRLIRKTTLHSIVQSIFQKSIMCRSPQSPNIKSSESPTKSAISYPAFVLKLQCPVTFCDFFLEPRKTLVEFEDWDLVTNFVTQVLTQFLDENNLYPPDYDPKAQVDESPASGGSDNVNRNNLEAFDITGITPLPLSQDEEEQTCEETMSDDEFQKRNSGIQNNIILGLEQRSLDRGDLRICSKAYKRPISIDDSSSGSEKQHKLRFLNVSSEKESDPLPSTQEVVSHYSKRELNRLLPTGKTPFLPRKFAYRHKNKSGKKSMDSAKKFIDQTTCSSTRSDTKWKKMYDEAQGEQNRLSIKEIFKCWENPNYIFEKQPDQLKRDFAAKKSQEPFTFEREMFKNIQILGQADCKFIPCVVEVGESEKCLVFFDQHAVHERVRLESILKENFLSGEKVVSSSLNKSFKMCVLENDLNLLKHYHDKLIKFGLEVSFGDEREIFVQRVPKCFLVREMSELRNNRKSPLMSLIQNLMDDIVNTVRLTHSTEILPKTIFNVLCSQACRGAVKFGDKLSDDECKKFIEKLSLCQAPFQCAHGRPSVTPIVKLSKLKEALPNNCYKFDKNKLKVNLNENCDTE